MSLPEYLLTYFLHIYIIVLNVYKPSWFTTFIFRSKSIYPYKIRSKFYDSVHFHIKAILPRNDSQTIHPHQWDVTLVLTWTGDVIATLRCSPTSQKIKILSQAKLKAWLIKSISVEVMRLIDPLWKLCWQSLAPDIGRDYVAPFNSQAKLQSWLVLSNWNTNTGNSQHKYFQYIHLPIFGGLILEPSSYPKALGIHYTSAWAVNNSLMQGTDPTFWRIHWDLNILLMGRNPKANHRLDGV